jgi:ferric-dicitrate binding protein FerR (iron transport regulator)
VNSESPGPTGPGPIESLLKLAGERDRPSREGMERARAAAQASWRQGLRAQARPASTSRRSWFLGLAAAASVIVSIVALLWTRDVSAPPVTLAQVVVVEGEPRMDDASLLVGQLVLSGGVLETGSGRVALAIGDALSLRVDRHTRLRLDGAGQVTLIEGGVYVDSGGLNGHTELRIDTPAGTVRHVGTQFQVNVSDSTRVQVREGRVILARQEQLLDIGAGDVVEVSAGKIRIEHGQPAFGAAWEWAAATAPTFNVENRPLAEFLAWLAREHGWQLSYSDVALQSRAQGIRLHGSMTGLGPGGMLERITLITGVPLTVRNGVLSVGSAP